MGEPSARGSPPQQPRLIRPFIERPPRTPAQGRPKLPHQRRREARHKRGEEGQSNILAVPRGQAAL
eukprot:2904701-Alexandrium_andersonii.AAC.1